MCTQADPNTTVIKEKKKKNSMHVYKKAKPRWCHLSCIRDISIVTRGRYLSTWASKWKLIRLQASPQRERTKKEVIMVDPLEAKRLAAKQMEEIKAKERFKVSKPQLYFHKYWISVT